MELKVYDVSLLRVINTTCNIYKRIAQDRLILENPVELDFNASLKLTKSFIRTQNVINNASEWGITDYAIEKLIRINEGIDLTVYDYESMLVALRYAGFALIIVGRTDMELIEDPEIETADVTTYLLDNLHDNTPELTNFYTGCSRSYTNDGSGLYPYAIDYADQLGLTEEEKQIYDLQASQDNYDALKSVNELVTFNDGYAKAVIRAKGLKYVIIVW